MNSKQKQSIQKKVDQMKVGEEKDARTILGEEIWEKIQNPTNFGKDFKKAVEEGEIENLEHVDELPNSKRHDMYRRIKKIRNYINLPVIVRKLYNTKKIEIGLMMCSITGKKETKQTKQEIEECLLSNIQDYVYPGKRYSCFSEINEDSAAIIVLIESDSDTEVNTIRIKAK